MGHGGTCGPDLFWMLKGQLKTETWLNLFVQSPNFSVPDLGASTVCICRLGTFGCNGSCAVKGCLIDKYAFQKKSQHCMNLAIEAGFSVEGETRSTGFEQGAARACCASSRNRMMAFHHIPR
jgi:hypothetical protein